MDENEDDTDELKSFKYDSYKIYLEHSTIDNYNVGFVKDKETARDKAEQVWEWWFSAEKIEDIKENQQPYSVSYNSEYEMWLITGTMELNSIGGVACVIIGKDGTVYAVWHGK